MNSNKQRIIILGGGYCGIQAAKVLSKKLKDRKDIEIVLIDRGSKHIYVAELYEVSTAYYEKMSDECLTELGDLLAFPLKITLNGKKVKFVQAEVTKIDHENKKLALENGKALSYDYLVMALGSVTNYYGIPGLEGNVLGLKTLTEALKINCDTEHQLKEHFAKNLNQQIHQGLQKPFKIIVGGGGFTGAEIVCEMALFIRKLAKKYSFNHSLVELKVIQALPQMIGLGERVSELTIQRFNNLGITFLLSTTITGFEDKTLKLTNSTTNKNFEEKVDLFIWTAGIKPHPMVKESFEKADKSGALPTKPTLESQDYPGIYAGGDAALIIDPKTSKPIPKIGQLALQEGVTIGENIVARILGKPEKPFKPFFKGFVIQLGGKYAVWCKGKYAFGGIVPWMMRKYIDLNYYLGILPPLKAIRKWWKGMNIFLQND